MFWVANSVMSMMWFSMLCKLFVVTTLHRAFIRKLVLALCHNRKWCHPGPRLKVLYPASSQVIKIQLYRKVLSACRSTRLFAHPHLPVSHDLHLTLPAHCKIYEYLSLFQQLTPSSSRCYVSSTLEPSLLPTYFSPPASICLTPWFPPQLTNHLF